MAGVIFKAYDRACKAKEVRPGKMLVHDLGLLAGKHPIISEDVLEEGEGYLIYDFLPTP